jgi:hypothetical protein
MLLEEVASIWLVDGKQGILLPDTRRGDVNGKSD